MSGETVITIVGNLVDEVELRFTPAGVAVAKFRVASTPRKFNRDTNTWEDDRDGSLFLSCSVWRQAAEHAAESLSKGMRVIVQGRLKQRSYEDNQGVKRTVFDLDVEDFGPSLKLATAKVTKSGGSGQGRQEVQRARQAHGAASVEDPWASSAPAASGGYSDEVPF
ncbi:single-stranded DNA-binding protein [Streptomyces sp. NPDC048516]|uniref:single-stranded DNA-binding protein n=1 Tax=Streptomyces sp. NPDC048516 TaxID=3365565 RepID=UPI00371DFA01